MLPHKSIEQRLQKAVSTVLPDADVSAVLVRPCPDPKFGDYQSNALMSLARARKLNPRQLASDVLARLDVLDLCEKSDIAGAGFLNFRLKPSVLGRTLEAAARGEELLFEAAAAPRTIVIDFSSPNVAKPMHVGHIRSTILGDSLARTFRLLGHRVITDNHIGDWGTQFGMLIVGWMYKNWSGESLDAEADPIGELEKVYKLVSAASQGDPVALDTLLPKLQPSMELTERFPEKDAILNLARRQLVQLQKGDGTNTAIWNELIRISKKQFETLYARLGVQFDHTYGESFYNSRLQQTVDDLMAKGIARESEGAKCVFSDGKAPPKEDPFLIQRDGEWQPNPQLIQKRDGGFNYATTDLATMAYRLEAWHPQEIVYVTDGRQQLHFQQLFAAFRRWHPGAAGQLKLAHVWFGSILGEDGRPLKTRSGENVKLSELLDEAEGRAFKVVSEKSPELPEDQRREVARVVGLGAVKYADLLPNRQSDYVFSWAKMLALNGNTAPYLQYAYARIQSIFRKAGARAVPCEVMLSAPEEISLANHLLNFGLTLEAVAEEYRPNFLCNYLYELAGHFTRFYENCPVLKSDSATRDSRLLLCDLAAKCLKQGLNVLGIETLEQM